MSSIKKGNSFLRILLILTLTCFISLANPLKISKEDLPKSFLKTFEDYKTYIYNKNARKLYEMQIPFFRYLNDFKSFEYYVNASVPIESIGIANISKKNIQNIEIIVQLKLKNRKNMVYLSQYWYKIKDKYYILTKNEFIFKY